MNHNHLSIFIPVYITANKRAYFSKINFCILPLQLYTKHHPFKNNHQILQFNQQIAISEIYSYWLKNHKLFHTGHNLHLLKTNSCIAQLLPNFKLTKNLTIYQAILKCLYKDYFRVYSSNFNLNALHGQFTV